MTFRRSLTINISARPAPDGSSLDGRLSPTRLAQVTAELVEAARDDDQLRSLVDEGRYFRQTPGGLRWQALLIHSGLAAEGWRLWHALELDEMLDSGQRSAPVLLHALAGTLSLAMAADALSEAALVMPPEADFPAGDATGYGSATENDYAERNIVLDLALGLIRRTEREMARVTSLPPASVPFLGATGGAVARPCGSSILR